MENYKTFGRYIANPEAANESLKLSVCAETDPCEDVLDATITGTEVIEAVTIDGDSYELPAAYQVAIQTDGGDAVRDAILWALTQVEFDSYLEVSYAAGDLFIWHIGQATINSITTDGGTPTKALTRNCTPPFSGE